MKKTHLATTLLFGLLIATLSNCTKTPDPTPETPLTEQDKLPLATQEGKNTFGCLIDGKAWTPKWNGLLQPGITVSYDEILGGLDIYCTMHLDVGLQSVRVSSGGISILLPGTYTIPKEVSIVSDTSSICAIYSNVKKYLNISGNIHIDRLTISDGIISGRFEFDAYSEKCQDTVHITKGRFDVKYK